MTPELSIERNAIFSGMNPRMTLGNVAVISERLMYRRPQALDLQRLFDLYSDPRTQRFNPAGPFKTLTQAKALLETWIEHWDREGYGWWAIAEQHAPEHIIGFGGVALHDYQGTLRPNIGYRLAVDAWGKGYATELGRVALRWAFGTPGIPRVWAFVRPETAASIKVLEKLGLQRCGVLDDVPSERPSLLFEISKDQVC
ncbi:MAG: GNAT family N-acetyltransferase [Janthinobacterium lividum]